MATATTGDSDHSFRDARVARLRTSERRETHTSSTTSVSSSSPPSKNSRSLTLNQWGRNGLSHVTYSPTRPIPPPKPKREACLNDDDLPFDQMGLSRPVPHCSPPRLLSSILRRPPPPQTHRPFDEPSAFLDGSDVPEDELVIVGSESSPDRCLSDFDRRGQRHVQVLRAYLSDDDRYRCASPPNLSSSLSSRRGSQTLLQKHKFHHPVSPPYTSSFAESDATTRFMSNSREVRNKSPPLDYPLDESHQNYEEFGLSPASSTEGSRRKSRRKLVWPKLPPRTSEGGAGAGDDDSLFNFDDDKRKRSNVENSIMNARDALTPRKIRRFRRSCKSEDETSSLDGNNDDCLQTRTKQAYHRRNRKLPKGAAQKVIPKTSPSTFDNVSCFATSGEDLTVASTKDKKVRRKKIESAEAASVASAISLNSEYTKSMESEVEDVFKDLLFIGSGKSSKPGRRSYRLKSSKKPELEPSDQDEDSYATETLDTFEEDWAADASRTIDTASRTNDTASLTNGENISSSQDSSASPEKKSVTPAVVATEDDPLSLIWDFLEGGVNLVSDVLGVAPSINNAGCSPINFKGVEMESMAECDVEYELYSHPGMNAFVLTKPAIDSSLTKDEENASQSNSAVLPASDWMLGEFVDGNQKTEERDGNFHESQQLSLQRDPRIEDLAFSTARFLHEIRGLPFDKHPDSSFLNQVEFKVIKIGLPLGVLFQENGGGCWVASVLPTGNAAKLLPEDVVLVGDQLVAVDGRSAIEVKVDDICTLISEAENTQSIELTFLRYIGPLSEPPSNVDEVVEENVSESPSKENVQSLPLEEHVFDTMHKMLQSSKSEEEKNMKTKKGSNKVSKGSKAVMRWLVRGRKKNTE